MDENTRNRNFKMVFTVFLLFLFSGFYAYSEATFFFLGKQTTDQITSAQLVNRTRRGNTRTDLDLDLSYTEANGKTQTASLSLNGDWPVPGSKQVLIDHVPGSNGRVRLPGGVNWPILILFGVAGAVLLVLLGLLIAEAIRETRPLPRKKKNRWRPIVD